MKYWIDTEFIEDGKTIELISIGVVAEDGREYYAQNFQMDIRNASDWVKDNVFPHLEHYQGRSPVICGCAGDEINCPWRYKRTIARDIFDFCNPDEYGKPEFWGYYADYDWVALCQLFGTMMELPKGWPMYCRDIKQWCDDIGNPKLPEQGKGEHHALADARWNKQAWEFLKEFRP